MTWSEASEDLVMLQRNLTTLDRKISRLVEKINSRAVDYTKASLFLGKVSRSLDSVINRFRRRGQTHGAGPVEEEEPRLLRSGDRRDQTEPPLLQGLLPGHPGGPAEVRAVRAAQHHPGHPLRQGGEAGVQPVGPGQVANPRQSDQPVGQVGDPLSSEVKIKHSDLSTIPESVGF